MLDLDDQARDVPVRGSARGLQRALRRAERPLDTLVIAIRLATDMDGPSRRGAAREAERFQPCEYLPGFCTRLPSMAAGPIGLSAPRPDAQGRHRRGQALACGRVLKVH